MLWLFARFFLKNKVIWIKNEINYLQYKHISTSLYNNIPELVNSSTTQVIHGTDLAKRTRKDKKVNFRMDTPVSLFTRPNLKQCQQLLFNFGRWLVDMRSTYFQAKLCQDWQCGVQYKLLYFFKGSESINFIIFR